MGRCREGWEGCIVSITFRRARELFGGGQLGGGGNDFRERKEFFPCLTKKPNIVVGFYANHLGRETAFKIQSFSVFDSTQCMITKIIQKIYLYVINNQTYIC